MRRHCALLFVLALCGCAHNPLDEVKLPKLCPRTSVGHEVVEMADLIRGHQPSEVIARIGKPAQQGFDAVTESEKLVWGPLVIDYRRDDGRTVPMNCVVEMYPGSDGNISRVTWMLTPAETNGAAAR